MSGLNEKLLDAAAGGQDAKAFLTPLGCPWWTPPGRSKTPTWRYRTLPPHLLAWPTGRQIRDCLRTDGRCRGRTDPDPQPGRCSPARQCPAAIEMGAVLSDQTIGQVRLLKSEMAQTGAVVDAAKNSIMAGLLPTLTNQPRRSARWPRRRCSPVGHIAARRHAQGAGDCRHRGGQCV